METTTGGYDMEGIIFHQHSNKLMVKLFELWPDKTFPIIDLGCGHNFYMNVMRLAGYSATGFDLVPFPGVRLHDVTKPLDYIDDRSRFHVLSLECGEHIPAELSEGYLDNLTRFGGDVIMSWAVPGQAGVGHVNCQSNQWVINEMRKRDCVFDAGRSIELRAAVSGCHCSWFINTIMCFIPKF